MKRQLDRVRHGELDIRQIAKAPSLEGYEPEPNNGRVIVGHSETGAVHCVESRTAKIYRKKGEAIAYLCLEQPEEITHHGQRHETTALKSGWHEVVVKREANEDESWNQVQD